MAGRLGVSRRGIPATRARRREVGMENHPRPTAAEYVAMYKGRVSESAAEMMVAIEADYPN